MSESKTPSDVDRLMKRCQVGVGGRNALDDAHSIMAECYGTLGRLQSELAALAAENERLKARYTWLSDKVMACDYGDNDIGVVGWHIRHCKGPSWIKGRSIDAAIDAAVKGES